MAKRNENVIAILLEPMALGVEFIEWPLHITIVPWFHGYDAKKLDELLENIAKKHSSFVVRVGGIEKFGSRKDVVVNVIDDSSELYQLHQTVFDVLEKNEFIIHQKDYVEDAYRAHITHQPHAHMSAGKEIKAESFALVKQERLKKSGTIVKKIVKKYKLA